MYIAPWNPGQTPGSAQCIQAPAAIAPWIDRTMMEFVATGSTALCAVSSISPY